MYDKEINNKSNKDNDLVVNDFKCNIDMIDPNMFFNNDDNDDYEYDYSN